MKSDCETSISVFKKEGIKYMSKKHPECPLTKPQNCKDYNHPMLCAFVREDKVCLKKKRKKTNKKKKEVPELQTA